jgi:hypothetical protein
MNIWFWKLLIYFILINLAYSEIDVENKFVLKGFFGI